MPAEPLLRVCQSIPMYPPVFSGMGIQIQRCLPFLRARGVEVKVLTCGLPASQAVASVPETNTVDRALSPGADPLATLRRVAQFRRYFSRHRGEFDVLHCNNLGWEFLFNVRHVKSLGLPVIVEMVLLDGDDPVATSKERLGTFKLALLGRVDCWVGISGAFLPRVMAAGIPAERFRLVYPGVDIASYRPLSPDERRATRSRLRLPEGARVVVSIGSVIRRKGVDRLLRTWENIQPQPGRDLLVVVGPATAAEGLRGRDLSFAEAVRERSRAAGLDRTVLWVGQADNVNEYLGVADLFLFLSRQEGLGIVILEALACGLPCVVSPLDGIAAEIVSEGETGTIVTDPDDGEAVAACVSRLLGHPQALAAMREAARRTAVERFSFDARADLLAALYRDLAARARKASTT